MSVQQVAMELEITPREASPFLKWAGGKSQLLEQFDAFLPKKIDRFIEPFVGGGSVFFHLKHRFPTMRAVLRDINPELINCYICVRDRLDELIPLLDSHLAQFNQRRDEYYYEVRGQHDLTDVMERAARMIFLNKTCFNGLWRVNASGKFNVPIGSYKTVTLYKPDNLLAVSRALRGADIAVQDFAHTLAGAGKGDFVYVDPPYHPLSSTASFTSYTKDSFGAEEQQKLADCFAKASKHGARLMLSNSDTEFTRKLYSGFNIQTVQANRAINSKAAGRGAISELLVLSW